MKKTKLLDDVRRAIRARQFSPRTGEHIAAFLRHLANERVSSSTQNQAATALHARSRSRNPADHAAPLARKRRATGSYRSSAACRRGKARAVSLVLALICDASAGTRL